MKELALVEIAERLERIERLLEQRSAPHSVPVDRDLAAVLAAFTGRDWFCARELWDAITAARRAAEVTGEDVPYLAAALEAEGVTTTQALGWWIKSLEPECVERAAKSRAGMQWRFL